MLKGSLDRFQGVAACVLEPYALGLHLVCRLAPWLLCSPPSSLHSAGFGFLLILCILRSCGCCCFNKRPKAVKAQPHSSGYPVAAAAGGMPPPVRGSRGRPPQAAHPAGVSYDGSSGQFLVNGRPYGQYQHAYGSQQHGRSASTTPLVQ